MTPPLRWTGSKRRLAARLWALAPASFDTFVELFAGSAAMFFASPQPTPTILVDTNAELITFYRVLRHHPDELVRGVRTLIADHWSPEAYAALRAMTFADPVDQAARTVYLNVAGFNALYRVNAQGLFNVPWGKRVPPGLDALTAKLEAASRALRDAPARLVRTDFREALAQCRAGDFVYVDPPYVGSFDRYTATGFGADDHRALENALRAATDRGVRWMLSGPTTLEGHRVALPLQHTAGGSLRRRKDVSETVLMNYGAPPCAWASSLPPEPPTEATSSVRASGTCPTASPLSP